MTVSDNAKLGTGAKRKPQPQPNNEGTKETWCGRISPTTVAFALLSSIVSFSYVPPAY